MSDESGTPSQPVYVAPLTWSEMWTSALTRPSEETYERIARDPNAATSTAYTWVFVAALVSAMLSILLTLLLGGTIVNVAALMCGVLVVAVVSVVGFAISSGLTHLIARALEGTGTYDELSYALAAYTAPLTIITSVLGSLPVLAYLIYPLGLYGLVLNVIAVKAAHRFGWGKAIASSIALLAFVCIVAVLVIAVLALLGGAVSDVFSDIADQLGAPQ